MRMPISNRTLIIILAILDVFIVIGIFYINKTISNVEESKIYFTEEDFINNNWTNSEYGVRFEVTSSRLSLSIDHEDKIKDAKFELNEHTGEIIFTENGTKHTKELYLRSTGPTNIVIWYDKHEYHLNKEKIYK